MFLLNFGNADAGPTRRDRMTFSLGDILIKIDYRATAETQFTRHHVMLVLDVSPQGNPIVMHMVGVPHCKLVREELKRGKDLTLIAYPWSDTTRKLIQHTASSAHSTNNFILTDGIIQAQREAASPFRTDCHFETSKKLAALNALFYQLETENHTAFTPNPKVLKNISCHEWVLSVIHYACKQSLCPIPQAFRIPPKLAWADLLYHSALNDKNIFCKHIDFLPNFKTEEKTQSQSLSQSAKSKPPSWLNFSLFHYCLLDSILDPCKKSPSV